MKKIMILFTALLMLLGSCKDSFLDQELPLSWEEHEIFEDETRIHSVLLSVYGTLKHGAFIGGKTYVALDLRGTDLINVDANLVTLYDTYMMNVGATYSENDRAWYYAYLTINRANVFLEGLEKYNCKALLGEELYDQYVAEAKFVRALTYYYLTQLYSMPYVVNPDAKAVPLRLTGIQEQGYNDCPRSTISVVYEQILKDIDDTIISALGNKGNDYDNVTRASQASARMLQMRVHMAMENWSEAIKAGEKITGYDLGPDLSALFTDPFYNEETIFSLPMSSNSKPNTQQSAAEYYYNGKICRVDSINGVMGIPAYNIKKDARNSTLRNDSLAIVTKFTDASAKLQWIPIFRYAETLLNLAECYLQDTNDYRPIDAKTALKKVRARSLKPADDILDIDSMTKDELLEAIANEKRLEFICEGMSSIEILRKGGVFEKGASKGSLKVGPNDAGYVWPIPVSETAVNKKIND